MRKLFSIILCIAFSPCVDAASAESSVDTRLVGVWKIEKVVLLADGSISDPGNHHYMITPRHIMSMGGKADRPKIKKNFWGMNAEEIASQLPVGAGFQKYSIKDGKLYRTTVFSLSAYYEGTEFITEYELDGDMLILRDSHITDGKQREWHLRRIE